VTAVLAFLRIAWPYLLTAAAGGFISHEIDSIRYDALQTKFATYQKDVAQADAKAQQAATDALDAQITARQSTEAHNAQVVSQLLAERDNAAADRDFARRLLAAAQAKPPAGRDPVPAAPHQSGTADPAAPSGDRSLAQDLGDAAGETRTCLERYSALQAQLIPQLAR
jgi:hypothetical protein